MAGSLRGISEKVYSVSQNIDQQQVPTGMVVFAKDAPRCTISGSRPDFAVRAWNVCAVAILLRSYSLGPNVDIYVFLSLMSLLFILCFFWGGKE